MVPLGCSVLVWILNGQRWNTQPFFTCSGRLPAIQVFSRVNVYIRKRIPIHLASKMRPCIYITTHTYYILHITYLYAYLSSLQRFDLIPETIQKKPSFLTISLAYHVPQIVAAFPSPKRAKVTHTHIYIYIYTYTLWLFNIAMENHNL